MVIFPPVTLLVAITVPTVLKLAPLMLEVAIIPPVTTIPLAVKFATILVAESPPLKIFTVFPPDFVPSTRFPASTYIYPSRGPTASVILSGAVPSQVELVIPIVINLLLLSPSSAVIT